MSTWHQVIFSDEMRLELYGSRPRTYAGKAVLVIATSMFVRL